MVEWRLPPVSRAVEDRIAAGKAARAQVARSAHAGWKPPDGRADPLDTLHAGDAGLLASLLPIRYGRMAQSPVAFFRGAAAIMAADLAPLPVSGIRTQVCGDAHLLNFGAFATPERNLIFDVNDFDETIPGAWEWDLKRLATSVAIAARQLGLAAADGNSALARCLASYRERMSAYAGLDVLDMWYARLDDVTTLAVVRSAQERGRGGLPQPGPVAGSSHIYYPTFAEDVAGKLQIVDAPPLIFHPPDRSGFVASVDALFASYRERLDHPRRTLLERFHLADAAYKVVGVGTVGTRCLVALFVADERDVLVLQAKEARESVFAPFAGAQPTAAQGERVVNGQRLMQASSDLFLGPARTPHHDFYVRQLHDMKTAADVDRMSSLELAEYAEFCGWALARAHAKAGGVAAEISGYLGRADTFDRAVACFARDYADQNERDYRALLAAIDNGRVAAAV